MEEKAKRNPYAKYHIDEAIKKAGIWYQDDDVMIRVTYAGSENSRYDKMLKLKLKPFETQIREEQFSDKRFHAVLAEVYAATVVLEWKSAQDTGKTDEDGEPIKEFVPGVYDEEGNILEASEENMIKGFNLGNRLFQNVIKVATNFNLFRQGQKEGDVKNS